MIIPADSQISSLFICCVPLVIFLALGILFLDYTHEEHVNSSYTHARALPSPIPRAHSFAPQCNFPLLSSSTAVRSIVKGIPDVTTAALSLERQPSPVKLLFMRRLISLGERNKHLNLLYSMAHYYT